jgi:hypothetical protein
MMGYYGATPNWQNLQAAGIGPASYSPPAQAQVGPLASATPAANGPAYVGGNPAGVSGAVGSFGLNTNHPPAQSGAGYLGSWKPQAPNPWANNLLPGGGIPVGMDNPAYNLFTNHAPGSLTPANTGMNAPGMPGYGTPTANLPASASAVPPAAVAPTAPGMPDPSGVSNLSTAVARRLLPLAGGPLSAATAPPQATGAPPAAPVAPPAGAANPPQGGMPPWMMAGPQVGFSQGAVPHYSPLLAASNPASGAPQAMGANGQVNPQIMQQLLAMYGGGQRPPGFADGGSAPPDIGTNTGLTSVPDSGASTNARLASLIQQMSHAPISKAASAATADDPIMSALINSHNSAGGPMGDNSAQGIMQRLRLQPGVMRGNSGYAEGGGADEEDFASGGALSAASGHHVAGDSGGQADTVNARLSDGEYVMDADVVSALGDGNNAAGARSLDQLRQAVRTHKRSAPADKIPPKAKPAVKYLPKKKRSAASAAADAAMSSRR